MCSLILSLFFVQWANLWNTFLQDPNQKRGHESPPFVDVLRDLWSTTCSICLNRNTMRNAGHPVSPSACSLFPMSTKGKGIGVCLLTINRTTLPRRSSVRPYVAEHRPLQRKCGLQFSMLLRNLYTRTTSWNRIRRSYNPRAIALLNYTLAILLCQKRLGHFAGSVLLPFDLDTLFLCCHSLPLRVSNSRSCSVH